MSRSRIKLMCVLMGVVVTQLDRPEREEEMGFGSVHFACWKDLFYCF